MDDRLIVEDIESSMAESDKQIVTPENEVERIRDEMRTRGESVFDRDVLPEFALG